MHVNPVEYLNLLLLSHLVAAQFIAKRTRKVQIMSAVDDAIKAVSAQISAASARITSAISDLRDEIAAGEVAPESLTALRDAANSLDAIVPVPVADVPDVPAS